MLVEVFDGKNIAKFEYTPPAITHDEEVEEYERTAEREPLSALAHALHFVCKHTNSVMGDVCVYDADTMKSIKIKHMSPTDIPANPIVSQRGLFRQALLKKAVIISYNMPEDPRIPKSAKSAKWPANLHFISMLLMDDDIIVGQLSLIGKNTQYNMGHLTTVWPKISFMTDLVMNERRRRIAPRNIERHLRERMSKIGRAAAVINIKRKIKSRNMADLVDVVKITHSDVLDKPVVEAGGEVEAVNDAAITVLKAADKVLEAIKDMPSDHYEDDDDIESVDPQPESVHTVNADTDVEAEIVDDESIDEAEVSEDEASDVEEAYDLDELADEIHSPSSGITVANNDEADGLINFFANNIYSMKFPLNNIVALSMLLNNSSDANKIGLLQRCVVDLLEIVNNTTDYAKVLSGEFELARKEYSLKSIIESSINVVRDVFDKNNLTFISNIPSVLPTKLIGDAGRLEQVFITLLQNASINSEDGTVAFTVVIEKKGTTKNDGDILNNYSIHVSIEDCYTAHDFKRMFDINETTKYRGLSMNIARHIIRMMGGDLDVVERTGDKGALLRFSFDASEAFKFDDVVAQHIKLFSAHNVVIISPEKQDRLYLMRVFHKWHLQTQVFDTLEEAEIYLEFGNKCSLILADRDYVNAASLKEYSVLYFGANEEITKPLDARKLFPILVKSLGEIKEKHAEHKEIKFVLPKPRIENIKVLIGEADEASGYLLKEMLEIVGISKGNIRVELNGKKIVEALHFNTYDVCILSDKIPVLNAEEITAQIRNDVDEITMPPVIVMDIDDIKRRQLFDEYLEKPIFQEVLKSKLQRYHQ